MRPLLVVALLFLLSPPHARAGSPPAVLCEDAIRSVEGSARLPKGLLGAIGLVESGRPDPAWGAVRPWPWTIDVGGQPGFFPTRQAAVAAVQALQAQGVVSIDVGCMQINLMHHPQAFASIEQAFEPRLNVAYAAQFLTRLHDQTRDWAVAAALYHSATPDLGQAYRRKVLAAWAAPSAAAIPRQALQAADERAALRGGRVAVLLPPLPGQAIQIVAIDPAGGRR